MMKKGIYILLLVQFITSAVKSQDVSVRTEFDTSRIYIGDQINYTITIDQPSDLKLNLPQIKDTLCKNIEILSGPVTDSTLNGDRLIISSTYLITSFDSGFYEVLPYFAESVNDQGLKRFYSDYAVLEVMRVRITPPDTAAKIFDIVEPYRAPVTVGEILPWVIVILIASALIWLAYRYLRTLRRKKSEPEIVINPDPAHVIAFRDLEKLRSEELWQKGEVKLYYSRLTEILRQYLENRYGVYSLELTTSETLDALYRTGFKKDENYNQLKKILTSADLVKFAKYNPEPDENESHFENSWLFVDKTKLADNTSVTESPDRKEVQQ